MDVTNEAFERKETFNALTASDEYTRHSVHVAHAVHRHHSWHLGKTKSYPGGWHPGENWPRCERVTSRTVL